MVFKTIPFAADLRTQYLRGKLFPVWKRKYGQSILFQEFGSSSKLIPIRCPPSKTQVYGFGELFMGVYYLDRGYEVTYDYFWRWRGSPGYIKALKLLGRQGAKFVCRAHPQDLGHSQPPDLFVFDREGRFFFVEVKLPGDELRDKPSDFFEGIEKFLNENVPQSKRAPCGMPKGHWIQVATLRPESGPGAAT